MEEIIAHTLTRLGACSEAIEWSLPYGTDQEKAWAECQRGDWMLWLFGNLAGNSESESRKKLVLCGCACARLALPHVKDGRVLACIETAEGWANGEASIEELRKARNAAYDAAYDAAHAADYAAAAAAAAAADAAAYAADAAAYAAAARIKVSSQCADIVRQHYPEHPEVK